MKKKTQCTISNIQTYYTNKETNNNNFFFKKESLLSIWSHLAQTVQHAFQCLTQLSWEPYGEPTHHLIELFITNISIFLF